MFEVKLGKIEKLEWEDILGNIGELEKLGDEEIGRLVKIKGECERRKRDFGILYYDPQKYNKNGEYRYQEAFHRDESKVRLILGGNQSGKTESAVAEGIMISLGIHPYKKISVPNKGRVIATDLDKGIGEVIMSKYEKLLPKSKIRDKGIKKFSGGQIKKIYYKNGSMVEFMSYEQDPKMFEGWTGNWVQFDEPPPRSIYIACLRGLMRYKGIIWLAMTPLNQPWIYDELYLASGKELDKPSVYTFDIRDNKYLSKEVIEDFENNLNEDEKEARLHGKFKHLTGLIYKNFGSEHKIKSFKIPQDWTRYCIMDYHSRTPCAILWGAIDPEGTIYFYDELWIDKTIRDISEAIVVKEKTDKKSDYRFIDSISATPDRITGRNAQREFMLEGSRLKWSLNFRSSTKSWSIGKNAVDEYLKIKKGKAGCYFFEDMVPRTIKGMTHYQWDEYAGTRNEGIKKESPSKAYAHYPDCVRYMLVMKPRYRRELPVREIEHKGNKYTGYEYGG